MRLGTQSKLFEGWCLSLLGIVGLFYYLFEAGFVEEIYVKDASHLTSIIFSVYMLAHLYLGRLTFVNSVRNKPIDDKHVDVGYEVADQLLSLGLMGTVIGLIIMVGSLTQADLTNLANVNQLFGAATHGMSTAFYATVIGLGTYIALKTSFYTFDLLRKK